MKTYSSAVEMVRMMAPSIPVIGVRPHAAERAARWFLTNFSGTAMYAVKANDNPIVVNALHRAGIRHFDVTSLGEIIKYYNLDGCELFCMHPIKSRDLIRKAYFDYGVRHFSLDCEAEFDKIMEETGRAKDLNLHVRIAVPNDDCVIPLDRKFGIEPHLAPALINRVRRGAAELGICFHVGSQALGPENYERGLEIAASVIVASNVPVDFIDVGGGFPAMHPMRVPDPIIEYMKSITICLEKYDLRSCRILAEPGRALVAESESLIVQVWARKEKQLYINDGTYGCLFEGASIYGGLAYPAKRVGPGPNFCRQQEEFSLWGPSCDSIDFIPGPFLLPYDMKEGDYIEIGLTGAYGRVSASNFNGFGYYEEVILEDEPILSMYSELAQEAVLRQRPRQAEAILEDEPMLTAYGAGDRAVGRIAKA